MKNILVTGGAGYIGSHTVKELKRRKYNCVVFDNLVYGHKEAIGDCKFIQGDLLNKSDIFKAIEKNDIDAVIHFAAFAYVGESVKDPNKYYKNNVIGTLNLLDVMLELNVKNIVFSSSCATYGNPVYTPIDEEHPQNPINPYGRTKLMIEQALEDYKKAYNFKYISLRYFNAAGCDSEGKIGECHNPETHLIPLTLKAIKGEIPNISVFGTNYDTPDGTCIRDYIHVEDLATAHCLALKRLDSFSGGINLGSGKKTSVYKVIRTAEEVTRRKCPVNHSSRRTGDPSTLCSSLSKAKKILEWEPQHDDIKNIIQSAWQWENR